MGRLGLRRRRRFRRVEVEAQVQLPYPRRHDAYRRRPGVFRRRWRQFLPLDAATGEKFWGQKIGGALGGGVIAYMAGGREKIAVATGFTNLAWPTELVTGKIVVLGLDDAPATQ